MPRKNRDHAGHCQVKRVKIAGVQFAPIPNDIKTNTERVVLWLRRAVRETGAKLVVFPESITTGFHPGMPAEDFHSLLPRSIDTILKPVQKACREAGTYCVFPNLRTRPRENDYSQQRFPD
jgi:predicted amidohydrolase